MYNFNILFLSLGCSSGITILFITCHILWTRYKNKEKNKQDDESAKNLIYFLQSNNLLSKNTVLHKF